jgi:hypothetical protein
MENENKKVIKLDDKEITLEQLEEAKKNQSIRIVEDTKNPGQYKTLKHLREVC